MCGATYVRMYVRTLKPDCTFSIIFHSVWSGLSEHSSTHTSCHSVDVRMYVCMYVHTYVAALTCSMHPLINGWLVSEGRQCELVLMYGSTAHSATV